MSWSTHLGPGHDALLDAILGRQAADSHPPRHRRPGAAARPCLCPVGRRHPDPAGRTGCDLADRDLRQHHPIDIFLVSLAEDRGPAAVGVLLSGGGSDGTLGLQAIRQAGGLTVAQGSDGTAPAQSSMPDSAIAAGMVDLVLPVQQIPERLVGFARALARPGGILVAAEPPPDLASLRNAICEVLRAQLGHDFAGYKDRHFLRRVQRRMQVLQLDEPDGLSRAAAAGAGGGGAAVPGPADRRHQLLPRPRCLRGAGRAGRAEAVRGPRRRRHGAGLGAGLRHRRGGLFPRHAAARAHGRRCAAVPQVQIFATDIDEAALAVARAGRYPAALLPAASRPSGCERFFTADGGSYVVSQGGARAVHLLPAQRDPRPAVLAARPDLLPQPADLPGRRAAGPADPAVPLCAAAGRLSVPRHLGEHRPPSATCSRRSRRSNRIFRRRDHARRQPSLPLWSPDTAARRRRRPMRAGGSRPPAMPLRQLAERRLLERFVPAHVVVNRDGEVLHYRPGTGKYLETAPARRAGSDRAWRGAACGWTCGRRCSEAVETAPARRGATACEVEVEGRVQPVDLDGRAAARERRAEPLFLVLFPDQGPPHGAPTARSGAAATSGERRRAAGARAARDARAAADRRSRSTRPRSRS